MAGGTKRLPRAVREQQMLDAAVEMFSINGYHDTSMDAIAAKAEISKPMLYLYYGSKEELFGACLDRELARFIDAVREDIDLEQSPRDLLHNTIVAFMRYIDANRASWIVMYAQARRSSRDGIGAGVNLASRCDVPFRELEDIAESVSGVREVHNQIRVQHGQESQHGQRQFSNAGPVEQRNTTSTTTRNK